MSTNLWQDGDRLTSERIKTYPPYGKKLAAKAAIVTGASKGIGAAIAKHLAAEGAAVIVNYASSKEATERVVAGIESDGGRALAVRANTAKKAEIERLFAETKNAFGRLDILVNNAGIYEFSPLDGVTEEHFHKHFDLNVLGVIQMVANTPLGRIGQPGDIALAVVFLASEKSARITGETIRVSSGLN